MIRAIHLPPAVLIALALSAPAAAHQGQQHTNLKILTGVPEKKLDEGMKSMTKGLGVKCTARHIDKHWDKDEKETKLAARTFFEKVVAGPGDIDRNAAMDALVRALDIKGIKDPAKVWEAVELFRRERKER